MGQPLSTVTEKVWRVEWGREMLLFGRGYNATTLLKRSLVYRERGTLQTRYLLWSTIKLSVWELDNPPSTIAAPPSHHPTAR